MKRRAILVVLVVAAVLVALLFWQRPRDPRSDPRASTVHGDAPVSATDSSGGGPANAGQAGGEGDPSVSTTPDGPLRVASNPYPPKGLNLAEQEIPSRSKTLVTGAIVDPEGAPIVTRTLAIFVRGRLAAFARTDRKGRFEISHKGGPFDLILHHKSLYARVTDVAAGTRDLILRARPASFDRTLRVKVFAPNGLPMKNAEVASWFPRVVSAPTGEDGVAVLTELPDHEVRLQVHPPLAREDLVESRPLWVLPEGQEIAVVICAGERIHGSVRRARPRRA